MEHQAYRCASYSNTLTLAALQFSSQAVYSVRMAVPIHLLTTDVFYLNAILEYTAQFVRYEYLTEMSTKSTILWDEMPGIRVSK
jgi:hypothetical protein